MYLIIFLLIHFQQQNQQACIILSSKIYENWGKIIQILNENLSIVGMKSIYSNRDTANEILQITNSNKNTDILTKGIYVCHFYILVAIALTRTSLYVI
jgi:hypothetical protein